MSASIIKINNSTDVIPLGAARQGPSDRRIDNNYKNNFKPRNDQRPKSSVPKHYPYFIDQLIVPRVKQYLEEHCHDIRIDFEDMVDSLQAKYREYAKRKRSAFKGLVDKAYSVVLHEFRVNPNSTNNSSNNQNVDVYSGSSDEEYMDNEDISDLLNDSGNKHLMSLYAAQSKKNSQPKIDGQELINISSSDDEDSNKTKSKLLGGDVPASPEDSALPPASTTAAGNRALMASGSMANPAFNGSTNLLPALSLAAIPPALESGMERSRKRKAADMAAGSSKTATAASGKKKREAGSSSTASPSVIEPLFSFKDFGGNDKVLGEVCKLLVHMRHPEVYRQIGVAPPRGFLLHGPPGCGKTLLAQAIAGELQVPLMKVASTELVAGVSGESEERIRNLFDQAVAAAPCVLFLDEVDAITPNRHTAQREMERRIVAQLLTCLDDLSQKENGDRVLVIGATNRPDSLDPALRRAGRFDREVSLGIPDLAARAAILAVACRKLRLAADISLQDIAANTPGFVGADLVALTREAAMEAVNRVFADLKHAQEAAGDVAEIKAEAAGGSGIVTSEAVHTEAVKTEAVTTEAVKTVTGDGKSPKEASKESEKMSATEKGTDTDKAKGDESPESRVEVVNGEKMDVETPTSTSDVELIKDDSIMEVCDEGEEVKPTDASTVNDCVVIDSDVNKTTEKVADVGDDKKKNAECSNDLTENADNGDKKAVEQSDGKIKEDLKEKQENGEEKKAKRSDLDEMMSWLHESAPLTSSQLDALRVEKVDFDQALKCVQPSAKREGFATVPDVTWDDVGSLQDIRDELQMAILAPVRHPQQFASLGLSTATGVLLCGPPGCGKTLLAKAVANEAGVNFISVKGPELLNMYVGESERAVRQCFQRARNSAPCVIFFDELDALCPKRSDSGEGGASMRVVNQMLTEMDGYEGRKGVYLMAATNRPDIVDPAVLRPGRLDKILYVGLPTGPDRVLILQALTKQGTKPTLAADVDLKSVGESNRCHGYTGADLAALVREAGIVALKEYLSADAHDPARQLTIADKHIQRALDKIRPSVSEKDQKYYEKLRDIYTAVPIN